MVVVSTYVSVTCASSDHHGSSSSDDWWRYFSFDWSCDTVRFTILMGFLPKSLLQFCFLPVNSLLLLVSSAVRSPTQFREIHLSIIHFFCYTDLWRILQLLRYPVSLSVSQNTVKGSKKLATTTSFPNHFSFHYWQSPYVNYTVVDASLSKLIISEWMTFKQSTTRMCLNIW